MLCEVMMIMRNFREVSAPYIVNPEDESVGRETILIRRNGELIAAVLPYAEYEGLLALKKSRDAAVFQQGHDDYIRLHAELLKTYKGDWVAMLEGKVVDRDTNQ